MFNLPTKQCSVTVNFKAMSKDSEKIEVHGTEDGKLYIKVDDLFKQSKIQNLITKIAASSSVKSIQKSPVIVKK
jgi:hypothetical protein